MGCIGSGMRPIGLVAGAADAGAAVVGLPNEEVGGERVVAAVVPEAGTELRDADLRAWCKQRLTGYKVPRAFYVVDELPASMLGKVLRKQVRESLSEREPLVRDPRRPKHAR